MATRGLSTEELATIRGGLAAGRRPRVQFTEAAGQIAGQIGQVVALADPAVADEFVVVRFGRDELPFSPVDLRVAPRGASAAAKRAAVRATAPEPEPAKPPEPEFVIDKPVSAPARPTTKRDEQVAETPPPAPQAPVPAARKAARPAKARPAAQLTITLAYADGEWTVSAAQGAKVLAKPYVVRPAEALRMVQLVDVPGVQEAVAQILASERADAEQQAQRLRAELAEVEARLAELGEAGGQ